MDRISEELEIFSKLKEKQQEPRQMGWGATPACCLVRVWDVLWGT